MSLCESIDTLAMAYLDDELAAEERHELETHLTECAGCRAELDRSRADQDLLRTALAAPRASDSMRMRLHVALDKAERAEQTDIQRAQRRKWTQWMLPGSAILAAAAAILVFVGVGTKAGVERSAGSVAKAGVFTLDVERQRTRRVPSPDIQVAGPAPVDGATGSRLLGSQVLPEGVNGHPAVLVAYDVPVKGRRIQLAMLVIENVGTEEMSEGEVIERNGRTLHVVQTDGHTAVTTSDQKHLGYMFMAEELSPDELVDLVSKTGLVGPQ